MGGKLVNNVVSAEHGVAIVFESYVLLTNIIEFKTIPLGLGEQN